MTDIDVELRSEIQQAYRTYLENKGFKPRYGQRLMIAELVKGLSRPESDGPALCVVEAGTGTGKTVSYLLGALPLAKHLDKRLVVSTATVALQEQIVFKDLPDVLKSSGLTFSFALAKGRGRYLCLSRLDQLLQEADPNMALYDDELFERPDAASKQLYEAMANRYISGTWDGDRDNWDDELDSEQWQPLTTDHRQCTNRRCSHFSGCSFFKARQDLEKADCIVANHDLVLADLSLGGGAILPEPQDTLYIFDEGHHLADKTLQHFSYRMRLGSAGQWFKQLPRTIQRQLKLLTEPESLARICAPVNELVESAEPLLSLLSALVVPFADKVQDKRRGSSHWRFPGGVVTSEIRELSDRLRTVLVRLHTQLDAAANVVQEAIQDPSDGIDRNLAERTYPVFSQLAGRAESMCQLLQAYARIDTGSPPQARWVSFLEREGAQDDIELACSPIIAAGTLQTQLWSRCYGALVTSATLTALDSFARLQLHTGLPDTARYCRVQSPFNYAQNATLIVPSMQAEPGDAAAHDQVIIQALQASVDTREGTLVLFSSWRQMLAVRDGLEVRLQALVLSQGGRSKQALLREHRERIDKNEGSILFGLASFAEGVDLPGRYLTHVVIAKIPFAVPDEPVEAALNEWVREQGRDPFMEIAVPDASVRLIQACGRLLRSESDTGRVTILDSRLRTRRYGRALLQSLPPFTLQI